ncbi:MAG: alpha/beta fold hydrolase [Gemmatimonadota bacterium]
MRASHDFVFGDLRITVWMRGRDGPPLLLLPGMGAHPRYYRTGIDRLSRHHRVAMPDLSFRSHERLPTTIRAYRELVERLTDRYAPAGPVAGHSFGGLLALLGSRPAIALSPTVPVPSGWRTSIARAIRLQLREYAGFEGRAGVGWAWSIMLDYVATAVRRPRCLFPAVSDTLAARVEDLRPECPASVLVLARHDALYRPQEYRAYLADRPDGASIRWVDSGHDWPVTDPELLEREVVRAARSLSTVGA